MEPDNPYTFLEGYKVYDLSRNEAGEIGQTVYDAPADVLKYVVVDGHTVPAERIEVNAAEESVSVPYDREKIETAPELEEFSGDFDDAVREHYADNG